jgi:hypothetical protein
MSSRPEESSRLEAALEGVDFVYSEAHWSTISRCLRNPVVEFRTNIEQLANNYLLTSAWSPQSEHVKSIKSGAARVAKAAREFLGALDEDGMENPAGYGLGMKSYNSMISAVRHVADEEEVVANHWGIEIGGPGRRRARRSYFEHLIVCWHAYTGRKMPSRRIADDDAGEMLDFLEAASRPVLVGADVFADNDSGRDAQRKLVASVRETGFVHWNHALDESFQLCNSDDSQTASAELVHLPTKP